MDGLDIGNLIYLVLLVSVIGFWFFVQNRASLGRSLQQAAAWGLIFLGVIAAIGLWGDIRSTVLPRQAVLSEGGRIEVPRAPDGHYYLALDVNGVSTRFVVDTGASGVVLTRADAAAAGIDTGALAFYGEAMTANGPVRTAPVELESIGIGPLRDTGFRAWVNEGEMDRSLLGMSYLQRFSRIEIADGRLVLVR